MKFVKMHGLGNDYVYINCFDEIVKNKSEVAKYVSDRHFGIGADGAIFINPSEVADCEMEMYNADGSRSEMCGNGIRCVAKFVYDNGIFDKTELSIVSMGKIKYLKLFLKKEEPNPLTGLLYGKRQDGIVVDTVTVDMGEPELVPENIPVKLEVSCSENSGLLDNQQRVSRCVAEKIHVDGKNYEMTCVSMGNPHAVVFVENVTDFPIEQIGPCFENHACFPKRVNAEFAKVLDKKNVQMRVWERGTGETLACGTGACATAVACMLNGLTDDEVTIHLLGGDLKIKWDREKNHVFMTGSATTVFEGEI